MKLLNLSAVVAILSLSACSNAPSESEARKVVQDALGSCRYLSINSFEKTNGIAEGENAYRVEIKYSVKMTPTEEILEDVKRRLSPKSARLAEIAELEKNMEKYYRVPFREFVAANPEAARIASKKDTTINFNSGQPIEIDESEQALNVAQGMQPAFNEAHPAEAKQYDIDITKLIKLTNDLNSPQAAWDEYGVRFYQSCPNAEAGVRSAFFNASTPVQAFSEDIIREFTGTIQMIKTDNGWQVSR